MPVPVGAPALARCRVPGMVVPARIGSTLSRQETGMPKPSPPPAGSTPRNAG